MRVQNPKCAYGPYHHIYSVTIYKCSFLGYRQYIPKSVLEILLLASRGKCLCNIWFLSLWSKDIQLNTTLKNFMLKQRMWNSKWAIRTEATLKNFMLKQRMWNSKWAIRTEAMYYILHKRTVDKISQSGQWTVQHYLSQVSQCLICLLQQRSLPHTLNTNKIKFYHLS